MLYSTTLVTMHKWKFSTSLSPHQVLLFSECGLLSNLELYLTGSVTYRLVPVLFVKVFVNASGISDKT